MKIGFFVQNYKRGGIDTFIKNLFSSQWKNDEIFIIYNKKNPGISFLKKKLKNVNFISYSIFSLEEFINNKNQKIPLVFLKILYSVIFPLTFIHQVKKTYVILKKLNLHKLMLINGGYPGGDIVLAAAISWSKINNKNKAWLNFHNFALKRNNFILMNIFKNYIDKIILRSVSGFVSVSKICSLSIKVRKNLKFLSPLKIYNGHDLLRYSNKRINLKKKFKLKNNSKILMMLAEYNTRKGHTFIIKCMEQLINKNKNIYLLIFGDGDKKLIQNMVFNSSAKNHIILNNYHANNISLLTEADIVVVPSQKYESFGYTVIESMSLKKLVVATKCGGLTEVIQDKKSGFLVDMKNYRLFAKRILFLLDNPHIKKKMEANAFKRYLKYFTAKKMINSYQNLIRFNKI